jgi:putative selenium metabolism protein SsnA
MAIVLENALLADIDPIGVERGALRIDGDQIVARGNVPGQAGDETIDCGGAVVLPGLVNGHTHLYSALAVGMPAPPRVPRNFLEILQLVWWRLDRALDEASNEMSATIGALDALRCGTTTLIDHHASPSAIDGSLDAIERGIDAAGIRGVLCYETTDRNGREGRNAGIAENRRYLKKSPSKNGRFAGLVGAHASFTLEDESLKQVVALAKEYDVGVHIHVAEDPCDEQACWREHHMPLIDRLAQYGLLDRRNIFAHGTHLADQAIARLKEARVNLAHNPRSNMNNAVGYTPIGRISCPILLGTDGIGADMFAEAKFAWFKSRDARIGLSPEYIIGMLIDAAARASASLGVTLGKLQPQAAADVVITDYVPFTPLMAQNFPGHFLYAMSSNNVRHVIAAGRWAMRDRQVLTCDEPRTRAQAVEVAQSLWRRMP